ncbi:MAG: undecaprenyl-diphosphatase UppP [Patescibacteria group bacterium]|nr:undecaprenyl-diphosphatase UppP [Patescibacteria group bacterium]MDD4443833.1 undecaprenyl-diphosphatase UppP [Patescibacteria group bacterium]
MTIFQSIILGLIEGLTEFLPISSTAHLIIASTWLKIPESEFLKNFLISIQLGAILSVAVLYFKTLIKSPRLILKIAAAFIPTSIIGLASYKLVKNLFMESLFIIAIALIVGGVILIILEKRFSLKNKEKNEAEGGLATISYRQSALIGIFQALAVIPGVSRSAATIMGGLSLGISRKNIVEFSFLLALPTMAAATGYDLYKSPPAFSPEEITVWIIGLIVSFVTAILGIKFFLKFIKKNNFISFGWYRIIIGLIVLSYLFI